MTRADVRGKRIAIPGPLTTAYLALQLYEPDFEAVMTPFDQIEDAVVERRGRCGAAHPRGTAHLRRSRAASHCRHGRVVVSGNRPSPPTRRQRRAQGSRATDLIRTVSRHLRASIAYGLEHRVKALDHAMQFSRGLDRGKADEFVGMYVNDWTLDYGERGRAGRSSAARARRRAGIDRPAGVDRVRRDD